MAVRLRIQIEGLPALAARLDTKRLRDAMDAGVVKAAEKGRAMVVAKMPRRTGLAASMVTVRAGAGARVGALHGVIFPRTWYVRLLEKGVKAHIIPTLFLGPRARQRKILAWPGIEHPVKFALHRGFAGRHMFEQAGLELEQVAGAIIEQEVNRAIGD